MNSTVVEERRRNFLQALFDTDTWTLRQDESMGVLHRQRGLIQRYRAKFGVLLSGTWKSLRRGLHVRNSVYEVRKSQSMNKDVIFILSVIS